MRKVVILLGAGLAIASLLSAETTQTKSAAHHKRTVSKPTGRSAKSASSKSAVRHTTATRGVAKSAPAKTTASKGRSKTKGKTATRTARSYQQAPTPERYQEIQQALIKKGYFQGEANGQWGPDSTDALKRFQTEQNLTPDGKINSLSLIALGLGPKRLTAQSKSANPPSSAPALQ